MARKALGTIAVHSVQASRVDATGSPSAVVRVADSEFRRLAGLIFRRYPAWEWATFSRWGWRDTPEGLVTTLASLEPPSEGDMDASVGHVVIREPYSLRVALQTSTHLLAVGVIHSHPEGGRTWASAVDDDMDHYYARYFGDFAPGRPYISLIFSRTAEGVLSGSGRIYWKQMWHPVGRFLIEREHVVNDPRPINHIDSASNSRSRENRS